MKIVLAAVGVLIAGAAFTVYWYLNFSSSWKGVAKEELQMFASEQDAAPAATQKPPPGPPVATVRQGEEVTVIWDTYGKDYWACYVRNSEGQRGWLMCPELHRT
jgi:hypothetical protein